MVELILILGMYYQCSELANTGQLTQEERFACNASYQQAKRHFLGADAPAPHETLSFEQNTLAYRRFKAWEADNSDIVAALRGQ